MRHPHHSFNSTCSCSHLAPRKESCQSSHHLKVHRSPLHCPMPCLTRFGRFLLSRQFVLGAPAQRLTSEDVLECELDVAGVKSRCLDEGQIVLACDPCQFWAPTAIMADNSLANCLASSVGTALRWRKSLLLPTSMMTMLASA
jgi:hypothetical protein